MCHVLLACRPLLSAASFERLTYAGNGREGRRTPECETLTTDCICEVISFCTNWFALFMGGRFFFSFSLPSMFFFFCNNSNSPQFSVNWSVTVTECTNLLSLDAVLHVVKVLPTAVSYGLGFLFFISVLQGGHLTFVFRWTPAPHVNWHTISVCLFALPCTTFYPARCRTAASTAGLAEDTQ